MRRPLFALVLAVIGLLALVLAGPASADLLTPESGGSANADQIDSLYKITLYVAAVVFVGVEGALIYSLVRFRASRNVVPAQIRGNTRLEISWTLGAALILVVLTVVTFLKLDQITDPTSGEADGLALSTGALYASTDRPQVPGKRSLQINVTGRQYIWRFDYPNGAYAYEEMVVPVGVPVILKIRATDVAHSWWIPQLGGKFDAVPGYTNWTWFSASHTGTFTGQCAELCGRNHANMTARVRVVTQAQYTAWVEGLKAEIAAANKAAVAQRQTLLRNTGQ